jgi:hypothetical protein
VITSGFSSHGSERIMEKAKREAPQPLWRFLAALRKLDLRVSDEGGRLRVSAPPGVLTAELRDELAARKAETLDFLKYLAGLADLIRFAACPKAPSASARF